VRRLKQCDEDIIPHRREREEELGSEVVDNCGAILAPHRTGECSTATDQATAFENGMGGGLRAAGCQDQRQGEGEGEWKQQRCSSTEQKKQNRYCMSARHPIWDLVLYCWTAYGIIRAW
jgi:hypothetical protein